MKTLGRALLAALLGVTALAGSASAVDRRGTEAARHARCSIALEADGSLSATVIDMPLSEALAQLADRVGAAVRWTVTRSDVRTTLSFRGAPLTVALARLLADYNYTVVFTRAAAGRPRVAIEIGSAIAERGGGSTGAAVGDSPAAAPHSRPEQTGSPLEREPAPTPAAPEDRARLQAVSRLLDLERGEQADSPVRDALSLALERNDLADVERATALGLAALPDAALEGAARANELLRPLALDVLARRAEQEPEASAVLDALAAGGIAADDGEGMR